jgi:quercetin dioxygenase-like cupin family protein
MNKYVSVPVFEIRAGLLEEHDDGTFKTLIFGFTRGSEVNLPGGCTHFGAVYDGRMWIRYQDVERQLNAGDYFCVSGPATILSLGCGMASSAPSYDGLNVFGGPIEPRGRLRYIDGCSDTLLVPPVRKGDPCLNHLHFPAGIRQTPHTHPSVRTGFVYRGLGECIVPGYDPIPLRPGCIFVIPTNSVHSFNTASTTMDVIAFHPDSDTGATDDDHPMINRTLIDGVSASPVRRVQTAAAQ